MAEGETATIYIDNMEGNKLIIDPLDLLNEKGRCYTDKGLLSEIAMIKAKSIFMYDENFDKNAVKSESPSRFEECTWNFKKGGYLYKFAEKFYRDIFSIDTHNSDLHIEYPGEFVNEDAALNIELDIQNSFSVFVAEDKPLDKGKSASDRVAVL